MGSLRVFTRIFSSQPSVIETTDAVDNFSPPFSRKKPKPISKSPKSKHRPTKKQKQNLKHVTKRKSPTHTTAEEDAEVSFDSDLSSEELYDITEEPASAKYHTNSSGSSKKGREPDVKEPIQCQLGGLVGTGSFGTVRMGLNVKTGELIAVKQVPLLDDGSSNTQVESLMREIEILSTLRHHNIVRYLGTGREENTLNIYLEFVTGGSIQSLLTKMGPFPEEVIAMYTKQILYGLEYLHSNNIIHRDIKGGNILVSNDGIIKVADFGASKKLEGVVSATNGSLKGTVYWMAPEVCRQETYGKEADIWSLGCTVYEMATGHPPWSEYPDQVSALFHIASVRSPPPLKHLNLSPIALDFLRSCLKITASKRPSARQLLYHPFVTHTSTNTIKKPAKKNSYSTPDYDQEPTNTSKLFHKATKQKHGKSVVLESVEFSSDSVSEHRTAKPIASPFVFLQRSSDGIEQSKKTKLSKIYK